MACVEKFQSIIWFIPIMNISNQIYKVYLPLLAQEIHLEVLIFKSSLKCY